MTEKAAFIGDRFRRAPHILGGQSADGSTRNNHSAGARIEHDLLGERELPEQAYYGVQTLRAVENFAISGITLSEFDDLIAALATCCTV